MTQTTKYRHSGMKEHELESPDNDYELAQKVWDSIKEDESISDLLENIQIRVESGKVTLTGLVFSPYKRMVIAEKVATLVDFGSVDNQLEVMGES